MRDQLVNIAMWSSTVLAPIALLMAIFVIRPLPEQIGWKKYCGYAFLTIAALVPPVWFFYEWVLLVDHSALPAAVRKAEQIRHSHDLGRNVWLAYIAVLASALGVKWPLEK